MLKLLLFLVGGFAILAGGFNIYIRLLGNDAAVALYAGGTRDLDLGIMFIVFGLILSALGAIIGRLDEIIWNQQHEAKVSFEPTGDEQILRCAHSQHKLCCNC